MCTGLAYLCRRKNYVHAGYVHAALTLLNGGYSSRVRSMLYNRGVPEDVIVRLLFSDGPFRKR